MEVAASLRRGGKPTSTRVTTVYPVSFLRSRLSSERERRTSGEPACDATIRVITSSIRVYKKHGVLEKWRRGRLYACNITQVGTLLSRRSLSLTNQPSPKHDKNENKQQRKQPTKTQTPLPVFLSYHLSSCAMV